MKRALIGIAAVAFVAAMAAPVGAQYYGWPMSWNFSDGLQASIIDVSDLRVADEITHSKPCAEHFERVAPGFCRHVAWGIFETLQQDQCIAVQSPSYDARYVVVDVKADLKGDGLEGGKYAHVNAYQNEDCSGWQTTIARTIAHDNTGVSDILGTDNNKEILKASDPGAVAGYVKFQTNSINSVGFLRVVGYYD